MQGSLYGMEMIMHVLSEACQVGDWLLRGRVQMAREKREGDHTIRVFSLRSIWEGGCYVFWESLIMIDYRGWVLHITSTVGKFKQEDSSKSLVCHIVEL